MFFQLVAFQLYGDWNAGTCKYYYVEQQLTLNRKENAFVVKPTYYLLPYGRLSKDISNCEKTVFTFPKEKYKDQIWVMKRKKTSNAGYT